MIRSHRSHARPTPAGHRRWRRSLFGVLCLLSSGAATAEVRVLIAFDADGYRVERVVRGGASVIERLRERTRVSGADTEQSANGHGEATLTWLDGNGTVLAVERMPDPRLARVPAANGSAARRATPERVELERGNWIAHGPDATAALLLRLPARATAVPATDEWLFELDTDRPGAVRR